MLGCGRAECCPDPTDYRRLMTLAIQVLPAADAAVLRRRVDALDALVDDWDDLLEP